MAHVNPYCFYSHAVFRAQIHSENTASDTTAIREASLYLIDLAGSERQKDTKTVGARLKEAGSINKSLSALVCILIFFQERQRGELRRKENFFV